MHSEEKRACLGASLCDELTAFHNAEKVEELEAESDMLRDTVARYRSLVRRKDEYLARIVTVMGEGGQARGEDSEERYN
ncbi:hypothetical protein Pmar_PMAR005528 [Perkinsus marinus ATCC 50983]|uniref:Uncharacterized protein n=1 Tax=Perkinsus marinus (strain ATCC 50983 / TXsc) TaxID=423536 RepID=C5KN84_PERM5|nr:hypothetical protein Pmar_PMAR005528 [Perkinsus marinus ATCC 50983]EER14038.1 hypothetical protein Pmar_PMAR005528 [Perkinsus marinus ATCC 50983]|eukprot:XP_002782243.1 hypothetical protein Pmar_PMAR005528 [Perkinsus marinus ATCC 50983]